ncbi:hypothetical protein HDU88_001299 [Geranomyces variabilis]|nr:hypothetical protein HDU88_001299 [Geranomyces variabilis]
MSTSPPPEKEGVAAPPLSANPDAGALASTHAPLKTSKPDNALTLGVNGRNVCRTWRQAIDPILNERFIAKCRVQLSVSSYIRRWSCPHKYCRDEKDFKLELIYLEFYCTGINDGVVLLHPAERSSGPTYWGEEYRFELLYSNYREHFHENILLEYPLDYLDFDFDYCGQRKAGRGEDSDYDDDEDLENDERPSQSSQSSEDSAGSVRAARKGKIVAAKVGSHTPTEFSAPRLLG